MFWLEPPPSVDAHPPVGAGIKPDRGRRLGNEQITAVPPEGEHGWFCLGSVHEVHNFCPQNNDGGRTKAV